jgi:hypothetical protein
VPFLLNTFRGSALALVTVSPVLFSNQPCVSMSPIPCTNLCIVQMSAFLRLDSRLSRPNSVVRFWYFVYRYWYSCSSF